MYLILIFSYCLLFNFEFSRSYSSESFDNSRKNKWPVRIGSFLERRRVYFNQAQNILLMLLLSIWLHIKTLVGILFIFVTYPLDNVTVCVKLNLDHGLRAARRGCHMCLRVTGVGMVGRG